MLMNKYVSYYRNLLSDCNKEYNKVRKNISYNNHESILHFLYFMLNYPTGIYSSYFIEKYYLNIAEEIKTELSEDYEKGSVLHIMTEAYEHGGHTRVVERWIGFANISEKHSVFFTTSTMKKIPALLEKEVSSRNGEIIQLSVNMSIREKGKKLREYASKYEKIVLHVHNFDAVPLIAFGTKDFKRPVIFSNHSDHLFWLGVSITDICVNYRVYGNEISVNKRHTLNNFITGLPFIADNYGLNNENISKKDLGIPEDCKIVLTYASAYKYKPISDLNIARVIKEVFQKNSNVIFIIIGMNDNIKEITEVHEIYGSRVLLKEAMPHKELLKYIKLSDVVIDSFPVAGGTSMLDACYYNKPIVSGCSLVGQMDYLMKSGEYSYTIEDIIVKLDKLINSEDERKKNVENIQKSLKDNDSIDEFKERLRKLYSILPEKHKVYKLDEEIVNNKY